MPQAEIIAAGAVVVRKPGEVLLVHRPRYDDWSFPKGKLDRGEHVTACAVREVAEETGLDIRLGRPLERQHYFVNGRDKRVHYWIGRAVSDTDVSGYRPNDEIDAVAWVSYAEAAALLTHSRDRDTLAEAVGVAEKTHTLIVLRHANARSRSRWRTDDRFRPLLATGDVQARHAVGVLAAYDVRRLVSSPSTRCVTTLVPYADATDRTIHTVPVMSEEEATPAGVADVVHQLLAAGRRTVLCTHRPVLPDVFRALGVDDPGLEPGELLVAHHRNGQVVATEIWLLR
ncbi:NUDIX hydrolase [Nocardioides sp. Bht2]|uniref:NUDIX hydrolase n=1 Tax=Nocardioides sp. Bht2 TaxID=3392297 RepID=UPI0039B6E4DE